MAESLSAFRVIAAGMAWRLFGARGSAATLLNAVSGDNEQNRMLAGISLVKGGQRSFDLITRKIDAGEASAPVIRLLPDIDEKESRVVLQQLAAGEDAELADAANQCIAMLDRLAAFDADQG